MNELLMTGSRYLPSTRPYWDVENFTSGFLKCTKWQEELTDSTSCRFRYFCDSTYKGNLPPWVDLLVCFLAATCYLLALFYTLSHDNNGSGAESGSFDSPTRQLRKRCLMPSGPILLPIVLLILSNGFRINTTFPLSRMGPALLQTIQVSALAFEIPVERSIRYALLEASTASGILHASLYLDTIVLPYYTGLDALTRSAFSSDECDSCICRRDPLLVGGKVVAYRGWSITAFFVLATLCARLACGLFLEDRLSRFVKYAAEGLGWVMVSRDCIYLMVGFPHAEFPERAAHAAICFIISMHISKKVYCLLAFLEGVYGKQRKELGQIP